MTDPQPTHDSIDAILGRLEELVEQLEDQNLPLEQAMTLFKEGSTLYREGAKRLKQVEQELEVLMRSAVTGDNGSSGATGRGDTP